MERSLTIIIPTRNRSWSLRETLESVRLALARCPCALELIVVDNSAGDSETRTTLEDFRQGIAAKYLVEPRGGKCHALNKALSVGIESELIAVLDDDVRLHPAWIAGVFAICDRWPDKAFFTGSSHVVWPEMRLPRWVKDPRLLGWAFSVMECKADCECSPGRWYSGNHFWFRAKALRDGFSFDTFSADRLATHIEMCEPKLMLDLAEAGATGVQAPDAIAGHCIQEELLDPRQIRRRAARVGRGFAEARMRPYRSRVIHARCMRQHPLVGRLFCWACLCCWWPLSILPLCPFDFPRVMVFQFKAVERCSFYREILQVLPTVREYRAGGESAGDPARATTHAIG